DGGVALHLDHEGRRSGDPRGDLRAAAHRGVALHLPRPRPASQGNGGGPGAGGGAVGRLRRPYQARGGSPVAGIGAIGGCGTGGGWGTGAAGDGAAIGSAPNRVVRTSPSARMLSAHENIIPMSGTKLMIA